MLNRIVIIGRLTRDPEMRQTPSGTAVCAFTLAVDRSFKSASGERETDFIPVVVWRQLGETCGRYLAKGKLAAVDGRLQIRTYQAQDGSKRTAAEVVAENVRFLSPKDGNSGSYSNSGYTPDVPEVEMMPPDDIPF